MAGQILGLLVVVALYVGSAWSNHVSLPCTTWKCMASRRAKIQTRQADTMSYGDCMTACSEDSNCLGYDWTSQHGIDDDRRCNYAMIHDKSAPASSYSTYCIKLSTSCPHNVVDVEVYDTCLVYRSMGYSGMIEGACQSSFPGDDINVCKEKCRSHKASCIGFSVISNPTPMCYLFKGTAHRLEKVEGGNYYMMEGCGGTHTLSTLSDIPQDCMTLEVDARDMYVGKGGTIEPAGSAAVADCLMACRADPNCKGITYDSKVELQTTTTPCKTYTTTVEEDIHRSSPRYYLYRVASFSCQAPSDMMTRNGYQWFKYPRTRGALGSAYLTDDTIYDQPACIELCAAARDCWALDWNNEVCSLYDKDVAYVTVQANGHVHLVKRII